MRVLHIIPFLWSGAGNVVSRLCLSQRASCAVGIVTSVRSRGFTDWPAYRRKLVRAGVEHFAVDLFDRDPTVFWNSVGGLGRAISDFRPNVVHCHAGVPAYAAVLVRQTGAIPFRLISTFHSWGLGRPEWMNAMDLWAFGQCDFVTCGAHAYERVLLEGGVAREQIVYHPWGIPIEEISRQDAGDARSFGVQRIGFTGRIEPRKCQLELIEAFASVSRRWPNTRLDLVGPVADEDYGRQCRALVRKRGLVGVVSLPGRVPNVYRRMDSWSCFVSLSSDEGQGIAILEAMALGIPVIGRSVAGVEDFLRHGRNGIALDSAEPGPVAEAIVWALRNPERTRKLAAAARVMVENDYNWDNTVRRFFEIYAGSRPGVLASHGDRAG